jgi:transposase
MYQEQVERWRQIAKDGNENPVLTMKEHRELVKRRAEDQREIKALKKEWQHKDKAMAAIAALNVLRKNGKPSVRRTRKTGQQRSPAEGRSS